MIGRVAIENYRVFRRFDLELAPDVNIIVGKNDTGKSTLIEAIALALTRRLHGSWFDQELSPYLINQEATREWVEELAATRPGAAPPTPPELVIELYFTDIEDAEVLRGTNNLRNEDACGVRLQARLASDFYAEYMQFVADPAAVKLVPTEYYAVELLGFSGNPINTRAVPMVVSLVDPATISLRAGVDYHLQEIIGTHLDPHDRVELTRQFRSLREEFSSKQAVREINEKLRAEDDDLTDRKLSLSIDISKRYTWESNLAAHLDDLPFQLVGKGDQSALKTLLAIGRAADDAHIILIEEPENHLTHTSLRKLLGRIERRCAGKQLVVATHSNYVLNRLGLEHLVLLGDGVSTRASDIPPDTASYFRKLAGYDTLRLVLADRAILVEGPSDELVVKRAYRDKKGKLPIEDGIDVISVGLSHRRFLDLAVRLKRRVWILTDNDGRTLEQMRERFSEYLQYDFVTLHTGEDPQIRTLEPHIVNANSLEALNAVLGAHHESKEDALEAMLKDKTTAALAIFDSETRIVMPKYIQEVVDGD